MNKKVLFFAKHIDSGGVSSMMHNLGLEYKEQGWEIFLFTGGFTAGHKFNESYYTNAGIKVYVIPEFAQGIKGMLKLPFFVSSFLSKVKDIHPDIIHVHWRSVSIYAYIIKQFLKIPFVTTIHLNNIPYSLPFRLLSFWGDKVFAISEETYVFMHEKFRILPQNLTKIYNGVSPDYFKPLSLEEKNNVKVEYGIPEDCIVFSIVARLEAVKGHRVAIDAYNILPEYIQSNSKLLISGEGSLAAELKDYINILGLKDNIIFTGHIEGKVAFDLSDITILPSYKEGFPVGVVEAMFSKVIVVRTPAEGVKDQIVNGETGFVFDFDDVEELSTILIELYDNIELRQKIADRALQYATDNFTLNIVACKTLSEYEKIITNK